MHSNLLVLFEIVAGSLQAGDPPAPRIKLPSFKDVQANQQKKARLQSHFQPGQASAAPVRPSGAAAAPHNAQQAAPQARPAGTTFTPGPTGHASAYNGAAPQAAIRPALTPAGAPAGAQPRPAIPTALRPPQHPGANAPHPAPAAATQPRPSAATASAVVPSAAAPSIPHNTYSSQIGRGNAILVNKNQNGNPLLKLLKNINYRFADVIPDYQFNDRTAAIFLSLKFHRLQPTYVHSRIKALQRAFRTFLLCHCDVEDPVNPLAQVSKAAIDHNCTLIVAFSDLECARYLELLKAYENKTAESLQPRIETEHTARVAAVLTTVRAVNKTDSATMGTEFGSLAAMFRAPEHTLSAVPGLGPTKVKRLHNAFSTPFFRKAVTAQAQPAAGGAAHEQARVGSGAATGDTVARVAAVRKDANPLDAGRDGAHGGGLAEEEDGVGEGRGDDEEDLALQATQEDREWLATQAAFVGAEDMAEEDEDDDFV